MLRHADPRDLSWIQNFPIPRYLALQDLKPLHTCTSNRPVDSSPQNAHPGIPLQSRSLPTTPARHVGRAHRAHRIRCSCRIRINAEILKAEAKQIRVAGYEEHILLRSLQAKALAALYVLDATGQTQLLTLKLYEVLIRIFSHVSHPTCYDCWVASNLQTDVANTTAGAAPGPGSGSQNCLLAVYCTNTWSSHHPCSPQVVHNCATHHTRS